MAERIKPHQDILDGKERETARESEGKRTRIDTQLPIGERAPEIRETLRNAQTCLLIGETGSGKTTQMPLLLLETLPVGARIAITQPRRMAVRSTARYTAGRLGSPLGKEIGYKIRHEDRTTEGTRATFLTDGILLR
ncbi:MAG: hypothetical protein Q7S52_04345, partial [bacterium]|nr:hypothetical protein [bacterium]